MKLGLGSVAALVLTGPIAHAQPAAAQLPNVRVTVTCADYFVAPRDGLQLTLDGVVQPALGIDSAMLTDADGVGSAVETDVGYHIARGHHHLALSTPDCASATDLDVQSLELDLTGQLAITNDSLRGTITAPNGFGFTLGGFHAAAQTAAQLTMSISYQHWVFAIDQRYGSEAAGGAFSAGFAGRFGPRWTVHDVELAAGLGIGGDVEPTGRFFVPAWASLTYKPTCDWGVQAIASYQVDPSSSGDSEATLAAGILWQPSRSCSQAPRLQATDPFARVQSIAATE